MLTDLLILFVTLSAVLCILIVRYNSLHNEDEIVDSDAGNKGFEYYKQTTKKILGTRKSKSARIGKHKHLTENNVNNAKNVIKNEFLTDSTFYPKIETDLFNAKKEIIIFSPFITTKKVNNLSYIFLFIANHINIRVVTKPYREQSDIKDTMEAIRFLKTLGITQIYCRKSMHEKLILIDRKIAYYGSLNLLSHTSGKEFMNRTTNPDDIKGIESIIHSISDLENI